MIVVDTSFVLDLLLRPSSIPVAPFPNDSWLAPSVIDVQTVSVVRGHLLAGHISREQASEVLDRYGELGVQIWPLDGPLLARMLELAHNVSAHDAAFVALAEALDAPLVTRDRRLAAAVPEPVRCILV